TTRGTSHGIRARPVLRADATTGRRYRRAIDHAAHRVRRDRPHPRVILWRDRHAPSGRYLPERRRTMMRRPLATMLALFLITSCAGPSKLAEKSQKKLAEGEH